MRAPANTGIPLLFALTLVVPSCGGLAGDASIAVGDDDDLVTSPENQEDGSGPQPPSDDDGDSAPELAGDDEEPDSGTPSLDCLVERAQLSPKSDQTIMQRRTLLTLHSGSIELRDLGDPGAPELVGSLSGVDDGIRRMWWTTRRFYYATETALVYGAIDTDSGAFTEAGRTSSVTEVRELGATTLVTLRGHLLEIIDVSDASAPTLVSSTQVPWASGYLADFEGFDVAGNIAVVSSESYHSGMVTVFFDLSNRAAPTEMPFSDAGASPLAIGENIALVSGGATRVFDVSGAEPRLVATTDGSTMLDDDNAQLVASGQEELVFLDVTTPSQPAELFRTNVPKPASNHTSYGLHAASGSLVVLGFRQRFDNSEEDLVTEALFEVSCQ